MKELPSITRFLPKILLAVTVSTCDEVYKKIALWLNDMGKTGKLERPFDMSKCTENNLYDTAFQTYCIVTQILSCVCVFCFSENYRLQSAYDNNLIMKLVFVSCHNGL